MNIINLTQHAATEEQAAAGVIEPANKAEVQALLTFSSLPSQAEIGKRAIALANIARDSGVRAAMIGGAGYLMHALELELQYVNVIPLHAFSVRESIEETQDDGSVVKRNVFRHVGFVGLE